MKLCSKSAAALLVSLLAGLAQQPPALRPLDERALREYAGVYQWEPNSFIYVQMWDEFSGLVAVDESGEIRRLYPTGPDQFFTGPGIALSSSIESHVEFRRDATGKLASLQWRRGNAPPRFAQRTDIERHQEVRFSASGGRLAGTLISPNTRGKHAAIILVHGSGPENRESVLPFARFLIRHGIAILGYDKRGVGGSTGDWTTASFEDLASDVVSAFEYLKTRRDIDTRKIGLLGVSQAGWIMPLAAVRAPDIAFLISVSGAGVSPAETTFDEAQNEMAAAGMAPRNIAKVVNLMKLKYRFAQTGEGWDEYAAARQPLAARMGPSSKSFPATRDDPHWESIRRMYFYDPAPALRRLRTPTLAIFGELDDNIVAKKNRAAWGSALETSGNQDYTLRILPGADHLQLEAKNGSNAEMASLRRFVPVYFRTVEQWLGQRIPTFRRPGSFR